MSDYIRRQVINYFIDSGMSEGVAKKKVAKLSDARVAEIYDTEEYFEREGK